MTTTVSGIYTAKFWRDAGERILGTIIAMVPTLLVAQHGAGLEVEPGHWALVLGGAAFTTLAKCFVAAGIGDDSARIGKS